MEWKCECPFLLLKHATKNMTTPSSFIVGSKLSDSFNARHDESSSEPPKRAVIFIIVIRFFIWTIISIPLVYLLVTRTQLLGDDQVLWWSLMLMPIGPPALILSVLLETVSAEPRSKMMLARGAGVFVSGNSSYGICSCWCIAHNEGCSRDEVMQTCR